ncbi:MAG: hypothetical protein LPJ95_08925, partial [Paracoccaceae bacterium]|nr:hypothetical protein [Paracoccaceae bacterium]
DGTDIADLAVFEAPGGRKTFEFDYLDPSRKAYSWRAKFLFKNGMTRRTDWARSDAAHLSIPAP